MAPGWLRAVSRVVEAIAPAMAVAGTLLLWLLGLWLLLGSYPPLYAVIKGLGLVSPYR